ncbi:MAG: hypothetical protein P8Y53_05375 [Pseudolabrys sp.]
MAISALIYIGAIVFGLSIVVVPVYLANRPTVVPNPSARILEQTADRALSSRVNKKQFPVAHLKSEPIVNPETVEELNAKAEAKADAREAETHHRARRRSYGTHRVYEHRRAQPSYVDRARPTFPFIRKVF